MKNEPGKAAYDPGLHLEAYRFHRCFPKHFHDYYVIGFVEEGQGSLICKDREYRVQAGDVVIYNPGDSHSCAESGAALDYRGLHIPRETMLNLIEVLTGRREHLVFPRTVLSDGEAACRFRALHEQVMGLSFGREEELRLLLSRLLRVCGRASAPSSPPGSAVERACAFMERHYDERISLELLARMTERSKSALVRAFTRERGVTPYRYLENVRIGASKRLLEQGVPPAEAALRTGFSDQSHFTNYFSRYIGLTPGAYRELFLNKEELFCET